MNNAAQIKSDTLNIILCNRIHERLNIKDRALKIARACRFTQEPRMRFCIRCVVILSS